MNVRRAFPEVPRLSLCGMALGLLAGGCSSGSQAPPAVTGCPEADAETVALYPFDDRHSTVLSDVANDHDGTVVGSAAYTEGRTGCGAALQFSQDSMETPSYGLVPNSPDWDLVRGSIDFWLRVSETRPEEVQGVLSRDASGQAGAGHLSVYWTPDGTLVTRLQDSNKGGIACSGVLPTRRWVHVGINFGRGGLAMFIDGRRGNQGGSNVYRWSDPSGRLRAFCELDTMHGIDGNENPWIVGALAASAQEGTEGPYGQGFASGAVDHLRISRVRRQFARAD